MATLADLPKSWHSGPEDGFHGKITPDGPFKPEKNRYHFYVGLFCPFAHRANLVIHMKQLDKYAGITTSIVKPYPKGNDEGWPGWQFNLASQKGTEEWYEGATMDGVLGGEKQYLHNVVGHKDAVLLPTLIDIKCFAVLQSR